MLATPATLVRVRVSIAALDARQRLVVRQRIQAVAAVVEERWSRDTAGRRAWS